MPLGLTGGCRVPCTLVGLLASTAISAALECLAMFQGCAYARDPCPPKSTASGSHLLSSTATGGTPHSRVRIQTRWDVILSCYLYFISPFVLESSTPCLRMRMGMGMGMGMGRAPRFWTHRVPLVSLGRQKQTTRQGPTKWKLIRPRFLLARLHQDSHRALLGIFRHHARQCAAMAPHSQRRKS